MFGNYEGRFAAEQSTDIRSGAEYLLILTSYYNKVPGDPKTMKTKTNKLFSFLLCAMLSAAIAFTMTGCSGKNNSDAATGEAVTEETITESDNDQTADPEDTDAQSDNTESTDSQSADTASDVEVLGEGKTVFTFIVTDADGNDTQFEIHTDKKTVGEALSDLGLIAGEDSEYGLYVKTVNGVTADYDTDKTYWAFYVNGEYAQSGVDATDVVDGDTYSFKIEK